MDAAASAIDTTLYGRAPMFVPPMAMRWAGLGAGAWPLCKSPGPEARGSRACLDLREALDSVRFSGFVGCAKLWRNALHAVLVG